MPLSVIVCLLAVILFLAYKLPSPYENIPINPLSDYSNSLFPGFPVNWTREKEERGIEHNNLIQRFGKRLFEGQGVEGVESVAIMSPEKLLLLDKFGNVHIGDENTGKTSLHPTVPYIGPGRPLGYHYRHNQAGGVLFVCNSLTGLLQANFGKDISSSSVLMLSQNVTYANDLDISADYNSIYFTSATAAPVILNIHGFYDTMRGCLLNMVIFLLLSLKCFISASRKHMECTFLYLPISLVPKQKCLFHC